MNVLVDALSGAVGEDMEIHEGARHKADDHADSQAKNQIIIFFIVIASQCRLLLREKEYQTHFSTKYFLCHKNTAVSSKVSSNFPEYDLLRIENGKLHRSDAFEVSVFLIK